MAEQFSLVSATNLFKRSYYKVSDNTYNNANVTISRIKTLNDFRGKERFVATPMSFSGGVGSGSLPESGVAEYKDALITSKKVYATCKIDREAIKASSDDEGAFVRATKETVKKCVESAARNASRIIFGDGTGLLGQGNGTGANVSGTGTAGNPYVVVIPSAFWKTANWEEKDLVQVVTGLPNGTMEATKLVVQEVNPATRTVKLVGTSARLATLSGTGPLAATDGICMQNSYMNDPMGFKGVLDAESGVLYNIPVSRRWKSTKKNAAGAGITPDAMNEIMLDIEFKTGTAPNLIVTSYVQYRKLLNQLEDQKRYTLPPRDSSLKGIIGFEGVEFMSTRGPIGVFPERFVEDDRMYFLNDNQIECHRRPGFGWFDDDGTVFLRVSGEDSYEARYGGYYENYIVPTFHGVIHNLAV